MVKLVTETSPILRLVIWVGLIAGVGLAMIGGALVYIGSSGDTKFEFFGQSFQSTNIGIASIFIGGALIILLVRRTLSSLDRVVEHSAASNSEASIPTDSGKVVTPTGKTADERDYERIRSYQQLFDRPAFRFPCIFEGALLDIKAAVDSVSAAIATGTLYSRDRTLLAELPSRTEFETEPFRKTLDDIRTLFSGLKRTIDELIELLENAEGKKVDQSPKGFFDHMEFLLCDLIELGVSQDFVQKSFALMDRIDTERNHIIKRINELFVQANIQEIPLITTSTDQLKVSNALDLEAGGPSYRWDLFYLRTHTFLSEFLEKGRRDV